jgi:hypothetical protein
MRLQLHRAVWSRDGERSERSDRMLNMLGGHSELAIVEFARPSGVLKMVVFFLLFLLVRGTPALLLYRGVLDARERAALALMSSTQLPLVLAITTLATSSGHMRASTAAALVGAAVLSTLVFPLLGLRLRGDAVTERLAAEG